MYTSVASSYARCRAVRVGVGWCWGTPTPVVFFFASNTCSAGRGHGCCCWLLAAAAARVAAARDAPKHRRSSKVEKNEAAKRGPRHTRNEMLPEMTKTDATGAVQYGLSI